MKPEEREELARLLPSPGEPVLPSDRQDLLKDHLMRELTDEVRDVRPARRPRRRFAVIAVPLATATAVAAIVVGTAGSDTPATPAAPTTDPQAVDLLNRIATVAAAKNSVPVRDDQYVYLRTEGTEEYGEDARWTFRRTDWLAVDGKREGLARIGVLKPLPDGSSPFRDGKKENDMTMSIDPNSVTYRELEALPTDPDTLYKKIWADTQGQGPTHEEAALEAIGSMLLDGATLMPDVNAALYRAAAKIPGVSLVENAKDIAGRPGVGLAFKDGDDRDVWVFDRKSLNYLGSDEVALLGAGVVDRIGDRPGG